MPTGQSFKGDMAVDSTGVFWQCIADGTPGTWIKNLALGQANTATGRTALTTSGVIANDGALSVRAANADYGVYGNGKSVGVTGEAPDVGVSGIGATGGRFTGTHAA